jgi:hypothetical protein
VRRRAGSPYRLITCGVASLADAGGSCHPVVSRRTGELSPQAASRAQAGLASPLPIVRAAPGPAPVTLALIPPR